MFDGFGKYDVYTEFGSHACYKDSQVLKNRLGLRNVAQLRRVEQDLVGAKQQYLLSHPIQGRYSPTHLCKIHRFLFEDIYPFAGRYRLETIKKGSTTFLTAGSILPNLCKLLQELRQEHYLKELSHDRLIKRLAYYLAELNYIHPFREGNGRAIREFFRLLVQENGYQVDWSAVETAVLLDAMIESVFDTSALCDVLGRCVTTQIVEKEI